MSENAARADLAAKYDRVAEKYAADVGEGQRGHANRGITFSPKRRMDLTIRSWGMPPRLNEPMK